MGSFSHLGFWRRVAWVGLAAGATLCTLVAVKAWRIEPLQQTWKLESGDTELPDLTPSDSVSTESIILAAITRHPFRSDRKRPASRYLLPGDRRAARRPGVPTPYARLRLLGTAVVPGGKRLAAFEVPGTPPRVVHLGDTVQGLELVEVNRGTATLSGEDTTLVLRLPGFAGEVQK